MTVFMVFMLLIFFVITLLLWCFRGFTREVNHPRKRVGYVIRLKHLEGVPETSQTVQLAKPAARRPNTLTQVTSAATVVSLALLLGSR